MPCRCDYMEGSGAEEQSIEIDALTQNLCFLCGTITEKKLWKKFNNQRIKQWWKKHQEDDTRRVTAAIGVYVKQHPLTQAITIAKRFIADAERVHPVSNFHQKWFYDIAVKEKADYWTKRKAKSGMKTQIHNKLTPAEIAFVRKHKV